MTIAEFKPILTAKRLKSVYIFVGPEIAVRDIYIKQIVKKYNFKVKWADDATEIIQSGKKTSIVNQPTLYILSECAELVKNEKAWKIFNTDLGKNMVIVMFSSLDKRIKFYKQYKDMMVEFEPLQPEMLKKYIKKEIDLSDKDCQTLMAICENDYGRCLLEIDKMKTYIKAFNSESGFEGYTAEDCFYYFIKSGTIYQPPEDAVFDFVDAVMRRDAYMSFKLMQESYDSGEATLVMISNLYTNFKAVLQVMTCTSRDIAKSTGLNPWQINNAKKYLNKCQYKKSELIHAMQVLRNAEVGIKSGTVEEMVAVPQLLVNIM